MANAWQQISWIAAEALNYMTDNMTISKLCARDKTADFMTKPNGYAVGSKVDIRTNPVYEAKDFTSSITIQDIRSSKRSMTIDQHFDVSVAMTAKEKLLDMDSFSEQVIKPAAYALALRAETYLGTKILNAAGLYTSADLFGTSADMALAKKAATFQQLSQTGRFCLVNDTLEAKLLGASYFNTYNNRGDDGANVFTEGSMGYAMGMNFHTSLQFPTTNRTNGTGVGVTNTTGSFNKVGLSVLTTAATTGTIIAGDRLYIAGVRRPVRAAQGYAAGATSIALVDPITEIIPNGAAITTIGSGLGMDIQGAIFDDASLALACPMLDKPSDKPSEVVVDNGFSIRVVQGYDMNSKTETISLDMIMGAEAYDPRRITLLADTL